MLANRLLNQTPLIAIILTALVFSATDAKGQFDRLINKTTNKLTRELEDMAVEKISDVIAEKAAQALEKEFDKLLMEAMAEDSAKYDRDSAYYEMGNSYASFLKGLNEEADLPEEYVFDIDILYEVVSGGGKPEHIRYYFSKSEPVMGIQTAKSETNWQFMVLDMKNDVTVMYEHKDGKKSAQAIPNMMKFAGKLAKSQQKEDSGQDEMKITKLSGKERIAGYKCDGWQGTSEDTKFETWLSPDLGIDWRDSFGSIVEAFGSAEGLQNSWDGMTGMVMKSESYEMPGEKLQSSMEAQEVAKKETKFVNGDYSFGQQQ